MFSATYNQGSRNHVQKSFRSARGGGGEVNRRTDGGVPFYLSKWYPKI